MLIKLKRSFFSADGVLYPKGLVEYNGDPKQIPSDAKIMSKDGTLPVRENTPKAGHGAKPLEEQVLDLIPGAGVTHQLDLTTTAAPTLSDAEKKEKQEANDKAAAEADKDKAKAADKASAEDKKEVAEGLKNAEKAAEAVKEATDPLAGLKTK